MYYKYLYKIILQEHLQDTLQTPLQSLLQNNLQNTPQRKPQQDYNIRCVSSTKLLHYSNTITSTTVATITTSPLIVYSRESEQYFSDRKILVHVF